MAQKRSVKTATKTVKPKTVKELKEKVEESHIDLKEYNKHASIYFLTFELDDYLKSLPADETVKEDKVHMVRGIKHFYIKNIKNPY